MNLTRAFPAVLVGLVGMTGCVTPNTSAQAGSSGTPQAAAQPTALDDTVLVRVVKRDDQTALVGARVSYERGAEADAMRRELRQCITSDGVSLPVSEGIILNGGVSTVLTDAHGEAHIHRPSAPMRMEARMGELWNETTIDPQSTTVVLPLDRDEVWDAELVDDSSQPIIGGRVCLFAVGEDGNERLVSTSRAQPPNAAVTLAHMQKARELGGTPPILRVRCSLPGMDESDLADAKLGFGPDHGRWQFVAQTKGSVVVTVRHSDRTVEPDAIVYLSTFAPEETRRDAPAGSSGIQCTDGVANCTELPLDRVVSLLAIAADGSAKTQFEFEGPRTPGETMRIELVLGERMPALTGRLIDPCGEPVRWRSFQITPLTGQLTGWSRDALVTDGQGRFHVYFDASQSKEALASLRFAVASALPTDWVDGLPSLDVPQDCGEPQRLVAATRTVHVPAPGRDVAIGDLALERSRR